MFSFRDFIIFLAGIEFFHTISHIFLDYNVPLPLTTRLFVLTAEMNKGAIIINAIITILLLLWAARLKK